MARNKNPEETVHLILDVAYRLFMEKGYEYTSIQDIIDNLGGLSKGAIYHHFKSKEDILIAVIQKMTVQSNQLLANIRDRSDLNGKEKLKTIFKASISRPVQEEIFATAPNFHNNSKFLVGLLQDTMEEAAPNYILPIIEQGIEQGEISFSHPAALAEIVLIILAIKIDNSLIPSTQEEIDDTIHGLISLLEKGTGNPVGSLNFLIS